MDLESCQLSGYPCFSGFHPVYQTEVHMNSKEFTPEEVSKLQSNPYVKHVTPKTVQFTVAFKERFWSEYNAGRSPRNIVVSMGLDPAMLGASRLNGIVNHIRDEANSGIGFREGRTQRQYDTDLSDLTPSRAMVYMQHQIAYLQQELEFIKKIILAERKGNRKCSSRGAPESNLKSSGK
jgi:hypothetical protein